MRAHVLFGTLLSTSVLAGCGGSDSDGNERFFKEDIGITFEYPDTLREAGDVTLNQTVGGSTAATYGLGLDNNDVIIVQRVDLNRAFTESDMDTIRPELDGLVAQLDPNAGSGRRVTVGGVPGFEYRATISSGQTSRYTILIDGPTQYTINCQYVEREQEISDACQVVLDTLERR